MSEYLMFAARLQRQQFEADKGRRECTGIFGEHFSPPGARGLADATPTRSRCPSYPSPVSKTGHSPCSLSVALLGFLAAEGTHCSQGGHVAQEGVVQDRRAQSQQMGVVQIGQVHTSRAGTS